MAGGGIAGRATPVVAKVSPGQFDNAGNGPI